MQDWVTSVVHAGASSKFASCLLPIPDGLSEHIASCRRFGVDGQFYERMAPSAARLYFILDGSWTFASSLEKVDVTADDLILLGPTDRATQLSTGGGSMVVMELSAIGWMRLVSAPASVAANRIFFLKSLGGSYNAALASSIESQRLPSTSFAIGSEEIGQQPNLVREMTAKNITGALDAGTILTVEQLAVHADVHSRTLYRYCTHAFGFSPMTLLKRQRLLRMLQRMRDLSPGRFADIMPLDYYDQAHFNRDFRSAMGATPSEYRRRAGGARCQTTSSALYSTLD